MKLSVQPERETDDKYENKNDDDFRPSPQQSFQPAHHGQEENFFDENEDAFISDYQSDPKSSTRNSSLSDKRIGLKMVKEIDKPMQQKIRKQSSGPETKNDLIALAKKLKLILDREPKPSVPTRTRLTPSTSAQQEQSEVLVVSFLHRHGRRKEVLCSYFE